MHVITANRLIDGFVVFLTEAGDWAENVLESLVVTDDAALQQALEAGKTAEAEQKIVGAYEIEMARDGGAVVPVKFRERIRAYGPTTHTDFARAEYPGHFDHPDGVEPVEFKRD
ncbi:MAG: DUF2849 domain-containing protein [Rhodospirillaceae bacterium]|jgi:hypothetical protein|nr:DUF2849 domain-containing protein [Rhodospirillaceae bacterium]MBT3909919.1 DUF2849 domain-containing protein [Rhodospirillaceae bacterium]MBT5298211.1 DUF2849 domain-containing protein [Rhodospirillaceae bacterium]MBT7249662.1 DUF2849 domain-containing protein [Rhodospirillaceae bacterium]MBT7509677.1 DUF2849 domain-containing protein [Rhodospirillaceae bacterium]